jgi:glycosyltransferase involved in cell wall biosynthesis
MISVCLASYNGQKYISVQINSILSQLSIYDELIIVDDCSSDNTVEIIENINDNRIKLHVNVNNIGHVKSFEKAITLSSGEIIFLSDQDDFWFSGRVDFMSRHLYASNSSLLILTNYYTTNEQGTLQNKSLPSLFYNSSRLKNIFRVFTGSSNYYGSMMAFKRDLMHLSLPFPSFVKAHDLHLALAANIFGDVLQVNDVFTLRTITGSNLSSSNRSTLKKIIFRFFLFRSLLSLSFKKIIIEFFFKESI